MNMKNIQDNLQPLLLLTVSIMLILTTNKLTVANNQLNNGLDKWDCRFYDEYRGDKGTWMGCKDNGNEHWVSLPDVRSGISLKEILSN